ncbi:ABC transporter ATP-binding protein [Myxococcota bacterium]|nr:ABC transporter ATP-binding protein [Myxococcota bacterium]MBU1536542.1 ABC transporter ATP-binding protein [Myxococcota bacterium]
MTQELLNVEKLVKNFNHGGKNLEILKAIDLTILSGEMLAVVGASGAGKSTLLHLFGGLDSPTSGKIVFKGEDITRYTSKELARYRSQEIGFVFQFHHLLPAFTAMENVMIPGLIRRLSMRQARQKAEKALEIVGLSHRLSHRPGQLSGGEQQRVAIARAVVMGPSLLLADEPTGNLDSNTGSRINDLLLNLNRELGMTILVVTHNNEMAALFPRKVTMADGVITGDERIESQPIPA